MGMGLQDKTIQQISTNSLMQQQTTEIQNTSALPVHGS